MPRVLLISNPAAARVDDARLGAVVRTLETGGWAPEVVHTRGPGDAASLARRGADDGAEVIVVFGGDGTVTQAVSGIVGREVTVGIIPGGTGNLLAGNLRIPNHPRRAARVVLRGRERTVDLGRVRCGAHDQYFAVACGAGIDADIMAGTSGAAKRRWGMSAYVMQAAQVLRKAQAVRYRVTVDGTCLEADALTVLIANCGEIVPPFGRLRAGVRLDDGLFEVVLLNANGLFHGAMVAGRLLVNRLAEGAQARFWRGKVVTVETDDPQPVEADGEALGTTPVTAEIVPGAMRVRVPVPQER